LLLAGIVAAPLGSAALFLPARRHARRAGIWLATRRFVFAVIGTVVLATAVAVILKFAHLDNWPGYKSGALNYALRRLTGVAEIENRLLPRPLTTQLGG
jgi:hypothetical protein